MKQIASILLWVPLVALAGATVSGPADDSPRATPSTRSRWILDGGTAVSTVRTAPNRRKSASRLVSSFDSVPHGRDARATGEQQAAALSSQFAFVDAYIDSKDQPLAAYQFELSALGPGATLVGVEGGDAPAFADPPYYDPKANVQNRIIIAAFSTGPNLPRGRVRVARVMVRLTGANAAKWSAKLDVAASADAKPISAEIQVSQGETP
jgi:hypothetical protein